MTEAKSSGEPESPRLAKLLEMAQANPRNVMTLYGIAMEYRSLGRLDDCIGTLERLLDVDPGHVPTHQQLGYALTQAGRVDRAREVFRRGIDLARAAGNAKAQDEMAEALAKL
jgi:tetratricopeptide (TPR) repeat protein